MRILHLLNHTARQNGHVHAAVDLACAQKALGHTVAVCSRGGDFGDLLNRRGVETIQFGARSTTRRAIRTLFALDAIFRAWRPDVVHAHMVTSAVLAWPSTRLRRIVLVTTVHNEFAKSAVLMGLGDRVIAVSAAVHESMTRRGIPRRKLRTVLNGTIGCARQDTPPPEGPELDHPAVAFVGGLHPRKGVADLIAAFDLCRATIPEAHLYIVGEGPYAEAYSRQAAACSSASNITFCGALEDPRGVLRRADVFVLPSLSDPAPLVIPEAREAQCAIIASAVDGIPELLDYGEAGVLTPPAAPKELARALERMLSSPATLEEWKLRAERDLDRFSVDRVARDAIDIYREALEAH